MACPLMYFPNLIFLKAGILKNFCHTISTIMPLISIFWQSFGKAFGTLFLTTCYTLHQCEKFDVFYNKTYILLHVTYLLTALLGHPIKFKTFEMHGIQVL